MLTPLSVVPIAGTSTYRGYFSDLSAPGTTVVPHRVYSATSADMLTWTIEAGIRIGTGGAITTSAEHPAAVLENDGSVTLYYCNNDLARSLGGPSGVYSATSVDGLVFSGETLVFGNGCDPDVVVLADGSRRMFYGRFDSSVGGTIRSTRGVPSTTVPVDGWWWNAAEGGRGYSIETRNGNVFIGSFLYTETGRPLWYVASGTLPTNGATVSLDEYSGGQTLAGGYRLASRRAGVGTLALALGSSTTATLTWPGGTTPITRYPFNGGTISAPATGMPQQGWWWNAAEAGRGFFIEVQGETLFMAGYMYGADGEPVWYISQNAMTTRSHYTGVLQLCSGGQAMAGAFRMATCTADQGTVTLSFASSSDATLTLPNGAQVALSRFRF
jgi:hypothetical protein